VKSLNSLFNIANFIVKSHPELKDPLLQSLLAEEGRGLRNARLSFDFLNQLFLKSNSQLGQDVLALLVSGLKRNGYFVEFGAADGVLLSNTLMLEKFFGWSGILSEPAIKWHDELFKNRNCHLNTNAVWQVSGNKVTFLESKDAVYSTIKGFEDNDSHYHHRVDSQSYIVDTISLYDLLIKYNAPKVIDMISIDTEGSEYEILKCFDFDRFKFRFIAVEHNDTLAKQNITNLLVTNGYIPILGELSSHDIWFCSAELESSLPF